MSELLLSGIHVRGPDKELLFVMSFGGGANIGLSIFRTCDTCLNAFKIVFLCPNIDISATLIDCRILMILSSDLFRCASVLIVGRITFPGINRTISVMISQPLLGK